MIIFLQNRSVKIVKDFNVNMLTYHCACRLSADGRRTFCVNVDSEALKPESWDHLVDEKPGLHSFCDISIYELHVRDFRYVTKQAHVIKYFQVLRIRS